MIGIAICLHSLHMHTFWNMHRQSVLNGIGVREDISQVVEGVCTEELIG